MAGHCIGVDPGDTTGIAVLDSETGTLIALHQFNKDELFIWLKSYLEKLRPICFVVEDFRLHRARAGAQTGSRFIAAQIIGVIQYEARQRDIPVILQEIGKKDTGEKFSQMRVPKNHARSHMFDAYNHAYFWLVTNKGVLTALQKEKISNE
jgi:hypothetical protein